MSDAPSCIRHKTYLALVVIATRGRVDVSATAGDEVLATWGLMEEALPLMQLHENEL